MRIAQLEEIEQRMVADLQKTLQKKNTVVNELASKSKGLSKVMQPRQAYKYAPRDSSTSDLIQMQAQSTYAFSGRKGSQMNNESAAKLYSRRTKSIAGGQNPLSPAAAPSSGQGIMFNDTSATQLKDDGRENEVHVHQTHVQNPIPEFPNAEGAQREDTVEANNSEIA